MSDLVNQVLDTITTLNMINTKLQPEDRVNIKVDSILESIKVREKLAILKDTDKRESIAQQMALAKQKGETVL